MGPPPVPGSTLTDTIHVLSSTVRFGSAFISVRTSRENSSWTASLPLKVGLFTAFSRMYSSTMPPSRHSRMSAPFGFSRDPPLTKASGVTASLSGTVSIAGLTG